jgi:Fic family protein
VASLARSYLNNIYLSQTHVASIRKIGEHKGRQTLFRRQTPEILKMLQTRAKIESTESSNRLEGVLVQKGRVADLVQYDERPRDRSEQEIAGYRDALALIHDSANHMPFSVNVIKQLHKTVYSYLPEDRGTWKAAQNDIVERDPSGNVVGVRFRPPGPIETPQAMADLGIDYRRAADIDRAEELILVPLAILDFLCIHPFSDGNGRVGRLLSLMLLYHFGYEVGRYISLERVVEDSRETYYEALEASSKGWHESSHDPFPWMTYFWGVLIRAYAEFEDRVGEIRTARGAKTQLIRDAVARRIGSFAISELAADCPGISRVMIQEVLRRLRGEGALGLIGRGRGAKWVSKI